MSAKPHSIIWTRNWAISDGGKRGSGNCSFCQKNLLSTARLQTHMTICHMTPEHVKEELRNKEKAKDSASSSLCSQPKIMKCIDTLNRSESDLLDQDLARFFINCNIPFEIVENKHFIRFIRRLKPAYNLPHRTKLSTKLLDQEEERVWT